MGKAAEYVSRTWIGAYFHEARESRELVLLIVAIALLLDNMLLTTVVPIIPEFLYQIRHQNDNASMVAAAAAGRLTGAPQDWDAHSPTQPSLSSLADNEIEEASRVYGGGYTASDPYGSGDGDPDYQPPPRTEREERLAKIAEKTKHKELVNENVEVGVMFASKAVVQLIANPFVGPLTNKIGYSIPMFCGFVIMFFSTVLFAFSRSFTILCVARALQGVGSSCSSVAGMGMLAERYPDDKERGNAMGIALGGLALGVLIGPPFGGFMYQFVGKSAPFLILAFLALLDGTLQLLVLQPGVVKSEEDPPSLKALISDPYILIASGAITFANMGIAMLEPSLPIFMMDVMKAEKWQLGAAFLPASISYLIGTNLFGPLGHKMGRWLASLIGMFVIGLALMLVPLADDTKDLIIPMGGLGFGIGMVDSSMMPELGYLVDIRHSSVYGGVYAIGDIAFCLGFAVGPAISGMMVQVIGFRSMMVVIGFICFLYAPLLFFLKSPPVRTEQDKAESLQLVFNGEKTGVKYANFDEELIGATPASAMAQQQNQ